MTSAEQALTAKIGLRLREARKARKLSLAELSARTGGAPSKGRISNYEQGLRRLGIGEAQALAAALGTVSASYLLFLEDEEFLSAMEWEPVRRYRRTDAGGRVAILDVAVAQGAELGG